MSKKHNDDEFLATNFANIRFKRRHKQFQMIKQLIHDMNENHSDFKNRNQFAK